MNKIIRYTTLSNGNKVIYNSEEHKKDIEERKRINKEVYTKLQESWNRTCFICGSKESGLCKGKPLWFKYKIDEIGKFNFDGKWNNEYICRSCYRKEEDKEPDSLHKLEKLNRLCRNGNLSKNSEAGKGFICEQIWCKARDLQNCNIITDNFHHKYDTSKDDEFGYCQIRSNGFLKESNRWNSFRTKGTYINLVLFCMNKDYTNIDRMYIIPEIEAKKVKVITIYKNNRVDSWYNKFQIDETPYNEVFHSMSLEDCPVLKSD
jgi:hypothetical protein